VAQELIICRANESVGSAGAHASCIALSLRPRLLPSVPRTGRCTMHFARKQTNLKDHAIEVKPRYTLADFSIEAKEAELTGLLRQLLETRVAFTRSNELTDAALHVLSNVAEVLSEYPEVDVVLEGYFLLSKTKTGDQNKLMELSKNRADLCRMKLVELGCTCDITTEGKATEDKKDVGFVKIRPLETQLLLPKERLVRVLERTPIKFVAQTSAISTSGRVVLAACSRIVKETQLGLVLTCSRVPRSDNGIANPKIERLARNRLKVIQGLLLDNGATNATRLVVDFTDEEKVLPVLSIDIDDSSDHPSIDAVECDDIPGFGGKPRVVEAKEIEPEIAVSEHTGYAACGACRPVNCWSSST